jgi:transposase
MLSLEESLGVAPKTDTQQSVATQKTLLNITPAEAARQDRIERFISALFVDGLNFKDACQKIGISRPTGYEYFNEWKANDEVLKVDRVFWRLIRQLEEENPEKVLDALTRLKTKLTPNRVDVKKEIKSDVKIRIDAELNEVLTRYDNLFGKPTVDVQPVRGGASQTGEGTATGNFSGETGHLNPRGPEEPVDSSASSP